ncbi:MAG: AMP-binding protein [Pseudomonadota bacterium]
MNQEKFWHKSYGRAIPEFDPREFETDLVSVFREAIGKHGPRQAVIFMGLPLTFLQIDAFADRFAQALIAHGFGKGDVVGINLPNVPEYVIAWLGAMKVGCVTTGISLLLSPGELAKQLRDSRAKGLVILDALARARAGEVLADCPDLDLVIPVAIMDFLKEAPASPFPAPPGKKVLNFGSVFRSDAYPAVSPDVVLSPDDTAYLMFTGGATGPPKGAILTHRACVSELMIVRRYLEYGEREGKVLSAFPMFHIAGLLFNAITFSAGLTQILLPDPRNIDFIVKMLTEQKPFMISNVPSIYYLLIAHPGFRALDHAGLEQVISAAAPFPEDSQKELERIVGPGKVMELWGMTETARVGAMNPLRGRKKLGTVGLPLPNMDVKLVDPETGRKVGINEPGEILIKGPNLMSGYFLNPEETALVLEKDGYLHTGDVAIQDEEGYLRLVDRTKDMIIVSGYKVFSKKVEDMLADHPAVGIMALVGVPNPDRPGSELVKAYVVKAANFRFEGTDDELKKDIVEFAKTKAAPYEVPKIIEFLETMPLTGVGKLDKKVLRAMARGETRKQAE